MNNQLNGMINNQHIDEILMSIDDAIKFFF
jgi:hypothetical protein